MSDYTIISMYLNYYVITDSFQNLLMLVSLLAVSCAVISSDSNLLDNSCQMQKDTLWQPQHMCIINAYYKQCCNIPIYINQGVYNIISTMYVYLIQVIFLT